jgi:hypothetical protein
MNFDGSKVIGAPLSNAPRAHQFSNLTILDAAFLVLRQYIFLALFVVFYSHYIDDSIYIAFHQQITNV